jgi:hypothetical protein
MGCKNAAMNAVEIARAVEDLASKPFDAAEFPFDFITAFGASDATIKRLRSGNANLSDLGGVPGITVAVLQRNNIHIATCEKARVSEAFAALKASAATANVRNKVKFILATDGETVEAEDLTSDAPTRACDFADLPNHFGYFLPLAGITTNKQISENPFDIRATGRLNNLYVELLKTNPDWATNARRPDMNHFMARLIFCFFAESTDIFNGEGMFTQTIEQFSARDSSNTHEVISAIFRAMNVRMEQRKAEATPAWADVFPYVNGGLFSGNAEVPTFSRTARAYLLHIGKLDWRKINPDIFGSMIQAVADDEERGSLGMHYTSVPNILKVLNPLFLDDLRAKLEEAGDNARKLLNLRSRMARIRVFDPACGSGNFLVIAYKEMRFIEAQINQRRGEPDRRTDIPLTNFRGIELRDFPAEVARLALIIAEYQCDVIYRGQKEALAEFLPLDAQNWITCGNALRLDWLSICPPTGTGVKVQADDLFGTPLNQAEIDFENAGGETYICGNPPYRGSTWQTDEQKDDLKAIFDGRTRQWKSLDYVAGWFMKAVDYGQHTPTVSAFVSTNSICQGQQVPILWPLIFKSGHEIAFAHTSFKWANLASHNAGVTVAIVGLGKSPNTVRRLFYEEPGRGGAKPFTTVREVANINAYLVAGANVIADKRSQPFGELAEMDFGNKPVDGGNLLLSHDEVEALGLTKVQRARFIRRIYGSAEFIRGLSRYCLWIGDQHLEETSLIAAIRQRTEGVRQMRLASTKAATVDGASTPHRFDEIRQAGTETVIVVPSVSSESRYCLPVGYSEPGTIVSNLAFALYDAPVWNMALIASRLHLVWIATVCGKMKTDFRYSNTLGWNTFPVPTLTEKNKADLTACAEAILLAREHYFPATIADMYDPERMDAEFPLVRAAHERNDEVLERIYIGRRFRNDTERLEKLFDLYTKFTAAEKTPGIKARRATV